jgi:mannose/cellobiose epimerase-like protein (N-acyl-D-glucosamine 2-epimerase family)
VEGFTFPVSDTIAGYVTTTAHADNAFSLRTSDDRLFRVHLKPNTYAQLTRNLDEPSIDCTAQMRDMLVPGRYLFTYGVFYPQAGSHRFEAQSLVFVGREPGDYFFEAQDWWVRQIRSLGNFYLHAQFAPGPIDYANYRTTIKLSGEKPADNYRQETGTISRLVYGFATAYLLTGEDRYLEGAEKGTEYLREHMRFYDAEEEVVYWYHGIDVHGNHEEKVFASEFGDELDAIPIYEQIYALAGPVQTYRVTGDPRILRDADLTLSLFERFFRDRDRGGYFSHLDPVTLDPRNESLKDNRAKKNWNSVGDHAPAYLVNLWLATGDERYAKMLEDTFDTLAERFPDYDVSPFIQERFFEDWSHDSQHLWQQNRGVVGHNLKLAWNLLRMNSLKPKDGYVRLARKIAAVMPAVACDRQRGGWYDVLERLKQPGEEFHRFSFHDRKAWWQQEQAILAYLLLAAVLGGGEYRRQAREAASFYNAFFLDHDDGAVYFNVLANGIPFLMGTERFKGSHSISGYHSFELCYLAQAYTNLLLTRKPLDLHFRPLPGAFKDDLLRVSPDVLPPGRVCLGDVWIDGRPHTDFDRGALVVRLPQSEKPLRVKVRLVPGPSGITGD